MIRHTTPLIGPVRTQHQYAPHVLASRSALSRRDFLVSLAAATAGTLLPNSPLPALRHGLAASVGLIDVHHHILPPAYLAVARDRIIAQGQKYLPATVLQCSPDRTKLLS